MRRSVPLWTYAMADIRNLAGMIEEATKVLSIADGGLTPQARANLATACAKMMVVVETPVESIFRMMMAVSLFFCLLSILELDAFANSLTPSLA